MIKYVITGAVAFVLLLFILLCLYFALYKKKKCCRRKGDFVQLENQPDDESELGLLRVIRVSSDHRHSSDNTKLEIEDGDDDECTIQIDDCDADSNNDSPNDCNSFTSDEEQMTLKERKRIKKKKRHSLFPFSKTHMKSSKHSSEKSSMLDLSESSSDTNTTDIGDFRYKSRSVESILTAYSEGVETFGEDLSTCRLNIYAKYYPDTWVLSVGCIQAECVLKTIEPQSHWKVHITILPFKKQRFKTTTMPTLNPVFNQFFDVKNIARPVLSQISVRYRLYGRISDSGPKKMAGEISVPLSSILKDTFYEINEWKELFVSNSQLKKTKKRKLLSTQD